MRFVFLSFHVLIFAVIFLRFSRVNAAKIFSNQIDDCKQISPSIVADVKDFVHILDLVQVDSIIAEHFLFDNDFRHAFAYVQTNDFNDLLNDLLEVAEVRDILDYLKILEPCSSADLDDPLLEIVLLEAARHEHEQLRYRRLRRATNSSAGSSNSAIASSWAPRNYTSFTSFVHEVLGTVSHAKLSNLVKTKCGKSGEFKRFYSMLRSSSFRPKVDAALKSTNLIAFVEKLQAHRVDVRNLAPLFFELVSWGPNI